MCDTSFWWGLNKFRSYYVVFLATLNMTLYKQTFLNESIQDCPAGIYLLKVKNRNTRTRCEICSKLTIKTLERRH